MRTRLSAVYAGLFAVLWMGLLQGCATRPPVPEAPPVPVSQRDAMLARLQAWTAEGRVGVQVGQKGYSLSFRWQREMQDENLRVSDPLGRTVMLLSQDSQGAQAKFSDGRVLQGKTIRDVLAQGSPLPLPVDSLAYWLQGRPDPSQPVSVSTDPQGLPATLKQGEWTVDYLGYTSVQGLDMPERLSVHGPNQVIVKVLIKEWEMRFADAAIGGQ